MNAAMIAMCILIGGALGTCLMIIISVMVVSGRQSDAEYREELKRSGIHIDDGEE
jgi:hypothetical protein